MRFNSLGRGTGRHGRLMRILWGELLPGIFIMRVVAEVGGEPQDVRVRGYATLYGARMAARQARIDYSPGGRLYAEGGK